MRGLRLFGRILSIFVVVLLALVILCNLYLIAARKIFGKTQPTIFGYSTAVVVSGSMSGSIEIDDLIITRRTENYVAGDVITYMSGNTLVTHRIVRETPEGFITKGDANNVEDREPIAHEVIVGKVVAVIPGVGRWIGFLRTPLGMCCLVLIGFLLIEIPVLLKRQKKITTGGNENGES